MYKQTRVWTLAACTEVNVPINTPSVQFCCAPTSCLTQECILCEGLSELSYLGTGAFGLGESDKWSNSQEEIDAFLRTLIQTSVRVKKWDVSHLTCSSSAAVQGHLMKTCSKGKSNSTFCSRLQIGLKMGSNQTCFILLSL